MTDAKTISEFRSVLRNSDRPLESTDAYYVPNLHGTEGEDVVQLLRDSIVETQGSGLFYFTGQRGTGKSTELLRLQTLLDGAERRCIFFDALRYLNDTQSIDTEMLMLMVAAGIDDWISAKYPEQKWDKESVFSRFRTWMQSEVALEKIELPGIGQTFNLKPSQPSVREKLKSLGSRQKFHQEIMAHIMQMCSWLGDREGRQVVVVVDSLERLRGSALGGASQEEGSIYAQVAEVFSDRLNDLRVANVHMVYAVPPYLTVLQNIRDRVPLFSLASVRVYENPFDGHGRNARPDGLAHMRRLIDKRWPNWQSILSPQALDVFALLSGGDLRQFILRNLVDALSQAQYALDRLPLTADDPIVEKIKAACSTEMLQLTVRDEWPLLAQVGKDHNCIAQNKGQQYVTLAHLLEVKAILNYRNGRDWYDLHPALWSVIPTDSIS